MDLSRFLPLVPAPFRLVAKHLLERLESIEKRLEALERNRP